jgi:hypothetical protein
MVDLIDKVLEYLLWLQEPHESFGGMPVCPFVKGDFETNNIEYIMYSPDMEFIEVIDKYVESGKRTGLAIQIGIDMKKSRKKYQTYLNKVIAKKYPKSDDQRRGDLSKAHKKLEGSRWWSSFTKKELKALHGNPTIYNNKENKDELAHNEQES